MTVQELAAFNALNDFYLWGGVFLGLIISGFFKSLLNFSAHRFERPSRIRFRNMNGRAERKDDFEYLYLYKGEYYTLEQRDFLIKQRFKNIKSVSRIDSKFIVVSILFICSMLYIYFLNTEILALKIGI
ncbi:hypothetical protein [Acinetobacter sp. AM]|uniref:hypothetical protein n=1 Tax=Acinetobacter sp. AM TaxID=2170730 RepID=UPI001BC880C4|nr:hypothetical protein [Acinetobacter sp. AM]